MKFDSIPNRRHVLTQGGLLFAAAAAASPLRSRADEAGEAKDTGNPEIRISPPEDLMREHGVLNRIMLIYEEALRRIDAKEEFSPDPLFKAATIARRFIEDYHEKLEEEFIFPRFRQANVLNNLADTLEKQHLAGRDLTSTILDTANAQSFKNMEERTRMTQAMRRFIRMYRPHEAREDTELFPMLRRIVSANEFHALGEEFEKREIKLFGKDGFFKVADDVAMIEVHLGIHELDEFTPAPMP